MSHTTYTAYLYKNPLKGHCSSRKLEVKLDLTKISLLFLLPSLFLYSHYKLVQSPTKQKSYNVT